MTQDRTFIADPPRRLLLTGDRKIGIVMVLIANGGAKTTYISLETIDAYAKEMNQDREETFAEILKVLYFVAQISNSDDPSMSEEKKEKLATNAGKDEALAEAEKVKRAFRDEQKSCMTDFSFLTIPGDGDIARGRYSRFTGLLETSLKQMAYTPPDDLPDWDLGPVLKGGLY